MPKGMFLKSEWPASNLSDPARRHTITQHCLTSGLSYHEKREPIPLELFTQYALTFQRDLVPDLEEVMVERIEKEGTNGGFAVSLANGEAFRASKVVIATGFEHTAYVPPELASLPAELLSHSSAHYDLSRFRGKDVTVIGGGSSALETAALLAEQGADVQLLARTPSIPWDSSPIDRSGSEFRIVPRPKSYLGAGFQLWLYSNAPSLFRLLPQSIRFERATNVQGPRGAWWLKERVIGRFPILQGHSVSKAEASGRGALLHVRRADGKLIEVTADHVIAATGYRFVLDRLPFLGANLKPLLRTEGCSPVLSTHFESSVPGLYFTGLASAKTFGPLMRFVAGTDFAARRLSSHLAVGLKNTGSER